jgi:hypothetical protein
MWYVTKGNRWRIKSGSFHNRHKRRMSKMWFYPEDSEKSMETATAVVTITNTGTAAG